MSRYIDADKLKKGLSIPSASIVEIGNAVIAQIDDIQTADVRENIKAYWKNVNDEYYSCSYCGGCADIAYHYCPWCGADMRGEA